MRTVRVYKAGIHLGEEPIVLGNDRSGMVNFSGCHLSCRFCYTPETSVHRFGQDYAEDAFLALIEDLVARGAGNLNLISPTHEWCGVEAPLTAAKATYGTAMPVVLKISGYEGRQLIGRMAAVADVLVPDFKVYRREAAIAMNLPGSYAAIASAAIETMLETHAKNEFSPDGHLARGIVVRHLLMPGLFDDSVRVVEALSGLGYHGYLNLMKFFIDPVSHALRIAPKGEVERLVRLAEASGMKVLVNGVCPRLGDREGNVTLASHG